MGPSAKRRKLGPSTVEEVVWDPVARHEYLTGFHKRKLQRVKQAQEAAERRARADKIEERRKLREERKAELARHVAEVNAALPLEDAVEEADVASSMVDSDEGPIWGQDAPSSGRDQHDTEYVDEEKYTTVTVESLDPTREGLERIKGKEQEVNSVQDHDDSKRLGAGGVSDRQSSTKRKWNGPLHGPRKSRNKFRYENKAERRLTRMKERSKKRKQAETRKAR